MSDHFTSTKHVTHAKHIPHDHPEHSVAALHKKHVAELRHHGHHVGGNHVYHHGHGSVHDEIHEAD